MLAIAPVQKITPTKGLNIIYNITPMLLFLQFTGIKSFYRQQRQMALQWDGKGKNKRHCTSHRKYWADLISSWELMINQNDACSVRTSGKRFRVNTDSFDGASKHSVPTQYNAYTDGSKDKNNVGCGAVFFRGKDNNHEIKPKLPDLATVFFCGTRSNQTMRRCCVR